MLQGINRIGKSWVGRVVVAILFGFLIVSFAIWGIGDIFRGQVHTQVATIGKVDVSGEAFRTAYQAEYQNLIRRSRQSITPDQARALGLEQRVLSRLVTEAVLDQKTRDLGLSVSDGQVIQTIQQDSSFRGANGQFDRAQFTETLRSAGFNEAQYLREQRAVAARLQIAEAVTGALPVPIALREAVHRYQSERRALDYVVLDATSLGAVPPASEAELQAFFDGRKAQYRAPEYRAANLLTIDPMTLAKPESVSPEEARAFYDRVKDTRYGTPEKRGVQQIVFPTREDAVAASSRIKAGESFEAIAKERNIDDATLNLGTIAKTEMFDPAVADAAFSLAQGAASEPIEGRFGFVLLHVTAIEAGSIKPFESVADEVRREVAQQRARDEVQSVHDAIEDQRAGARSLADIARERKLPLVSVETDRSGLGKDGAAAAGLPSDSANLVSALFRADVGTDNEAVRTRDGGYVWFDIANVVPARDRPLAEIRDRVAADQRLDDLSRRLTERARALAGRLDGGEALEKIAGEIGSKVENAADLVRGAAIGDLTRTVVTRAFATPVGKAADASSGDEKRVVFRVAKATVPPFVTTTQEATGIEDQLRASLSEDLLAEYIGDAQKQIGVSTYPENIRRAVGGEL